MTKDVIRLPSRNRRRVFWFVVISIGLGTLTWLVTADHWWHGLKSGVYYGGRPSPISQVYRSPQNQYLVRLNELPEQGAYVIDPASGTVGLANYSAFVPF